MSRESYNASKQLFGNNCDSSIISHSLFKYFPDIGYFGYLQLFNILNNSTLAPFLHESLPTFQIISLGGFPAIK